MRLILIRHGRSIAQDQHLVVGHTDSPLSQKGIDELLKYKDIFVFPETDYYFSSDLSRATQTFNIYFPDKKIDKLIKDFREHHLGDFEGKEIDWQSKESSDWLYDEASHNEENFSDFKKRVVNAVLNIYKEYGDISCTITCHAGVIRAILIHLLKLNALKYRSMRIPNGLAYIIDFDVINNELILKDYYVIDNQPIMMKDNLKILLLRHGRTTMNDESKLCGSSDCSLSDRGINELKELKETTNYPIVDLYYSSNKKRAIETSDILYPNQEFIRSNNFNEIDFYEEEGNHFTWDDYNTIFKDWMMGNVKEYENIDDAKARLLRGISKVIDNLVINDHASAVIIFHGLAMKVLLGLLKKVEPLTDCIDFKSSNGKGYLLNINVDWEGIKVIEEEKF